MENQDSNNNFWISYADLMAGLLFVFILLIGAIIAKYSLLQNESKILEQTLKKEKIALEDNKKELSRKELKIQNTVLDLAYSKEMLKKIEEELKSIKISLKESLVDREKLKLQRNSLRLNVDELKQSDKDKETKLDKLLEDVLVKEKLILSFEQINKSRVSELEYQHEILEKIQKELENSKITLKENLLQSEKLKLKSKEELENLKSKNDVLSIDYEKLKNNVLEKDLKLDKLLEDVLLKEKLILSFKDKNSLLDDELKLLETKLESTQNQHNILSKNLESTKSRIKNLTGIKVKVISLLKNKLGKNMKIDPKNGAIRLSSNILFDEGEYKLKESSKLDLKNAVYDYFNTILENKEINKHIDKVVIEGHTNSVGTYLYNLELSQKRAYSVMDFLLSLDFKKKDNLKELLVASGRSFLDPIFDKNGVENKDESRRIEIKFNLKNEEAIKEIENILE